MAFLTGLEGGKQETGYSKDNWDLVSVIETETEGRRTLMHFSGYKKNGSDIYASKVNAYTPYSFDTNLVSYFKTSKLTGYTNYSMNAKGYCPLLGSGIQYNGGDTIVVKYITGGELEITRKSSGHKTKGYFGNVFTLFVQGAGGGGGAGGNWTYNKNPGGQGGMRGPNIGFIIECPRKTTENFLKIVLGSGGSGGVASKNTSGQGNNGANTYVYFKGELVATIPGGKGGVFGKVMDRKSKYDPNYPWHVAPQMNKNIYNSIYGTQGTGRIRLAPGYFNASREWTSTAVYPSGDAKTTCYGVVGSHYAYYDGVDTALNISRNWYDSSGFWVDYSYTMTDGNKNSNKRYNSTSSQPGCKEAGIGAAPGLPGARSMFGNGGSASGGNGGIGAGGGGGDANVAMFGGYGKGGGKGGAACCIFSNYRSKSAGTTVEVPIKY